MRALFISIIVLSFTSVTQTSAQQSDLLAASSGEHLWIVRPSQATGDRFDLLHHAMDMRGPYAAATVQLYAQPEAIAAFGDRVWIVSRAQGAWRSVHSLRIRKRTELDMYFTEPENRLAVLAPLHGDGELVSLTATATGPAALIAHHDSTYRLFELRGERWAQSDLPDALTGDTAMLAVDGPNLSRLNLLVSDPDESARSYLYRREQGVWSAEPAQIDLNLHAVRSLTHVQGRLAAVITTSDEEVSIAYVRAGHLLELAVLAMPSQPWVIAGMNDAFRMIAQHEDDAHVLTMRLIHWLTGEISPIEDVVRPPLPSGRLWHVAIMLTIAVIAVLLVLLVRPGAAGADAKDKGSAGEGVTVKGAANDEAPTLPKGVVVLPALTRLMALVIDLVPGGILAVLVLRVPPIELLRLPIVTNSLDQAAPYLVMIGVMFVHVLISEWLAATSLGKVLMGGRVISQDGTRPRIGQIAVRNALKLLILMVPPLAIFALLSNHLQGFNDLLAKTIVVGDLADDGEADNGAESDNGNESG